MAPLFLFLLSLLFYHISELLLVCLLTPSELDLSSLLLSPPYLLAMTLGLLEHTISNRLFPIQKATLLSTFLPPGLVLVLLGEALRKLAWLTARASFTHRIQPTRRPCHALVTSGVYRWCRHPGYVGWLVWAVGTQLILGNPICALAFAVVAWRFFSERIPVEEFYLVRIFGKDYVNYRRRTPSGIPGIA